MSDFFWFSDEQWARIEPFPSADARGMARVDDRRVLSGIVHALKNVGRWTDCPREIYRPPRSNRKVQYVYDKAIHRERNVIERMFCRLKDCRRIATRLDQNITNFMAAIALAAAVIWWL
jgi:transposase